MLPRLLFMNIKHLNFNEILAVEEALSKLVIKEPLQNIRFFLCDALATFLDVCEENNKVWEEFTKENQWISIFSLANQLVKSQELLATGLYLWQRIFTLFPSSGSNELLFALMTLVLNSLSSDLFDDRVQALKLFEILLGNIPDQLGSDSQKELIYNVLQQIFDELKIVALQTQNVDELVIAVKVISDFLDNPPPFIEFEQLNDFFELSFLILSNKNVPLKIRFAIHQIIESSIDIIIDNYKDRLTILMQLSIDLSIEVCRCQRDDNIYEFPLSFFYSISDAYDDEVNDILDLFLNLAFNICNNQNSDDINLFLAQRQVALFLIMTIVEGTQEAIHERISDILQFVIQTGDVDDPFVFYVCCRTLSELIQYLSAQMSCYIDDIASFLLKYIKYDDSILMLDTLFSKCCQPPKNIIAIFNVLISLIETWSNNIEKVESILSCIFSLLSTVNSYFSLGYNNLEEDINTNEYNTESLLKTLLPILEFIQEKRPELKGNIIEFIGKCVDIAPLYVKNQLPKIFQINIITASLSKPSEPHFFVSFTNFIKEIAKVFPVSFLPFFPHIVPLIIPYIQDSLDMDHISSEQKIAAITCLVFLVGSLPNHMSEFVMFPILDYLINRNGINHYVDEICDSIAASCEGFQEIGVPLDDIMLKVIPKVLDGHCRKEELISIFHMLSNIVEVYGIDLKDQTIRILFSFIAKILASPPSGMLRTQHSTYIDQQIQVPFFILISKVIQTDFSMKKRNTDLETESDNDFETAKAELIQYILPYIPNNSPLMRAYSILSVSHIYSWLLLGNSIFSHVNQENAQNEELNKLFQFLSDVILDSIKKIQNIDARKLIAKALSYLIACRYDYFIRSPQTLAEIFIPFATEMIEFCGYTGLWCIISIRYSNFLEDNIAVLEAIINEFPNGTENIQFESEFSLFLNTNPTLSRYAQTVEGYEEKIQLIACSLFASYDKLFHIVDNNVKDYFCKVLMNLSNDRLLQLVRFNEGNLVKIQRHIKLQNLSHIA